MNFAPTTKQRITTNRRRWSRLSIISVVLGWMTFGLAVPAMAQDNVVYFHNDILGSAMSAYNEQGDVCWEQTYAPYGEQLSGTVNATPPPGCGFQSSERGYTGHTQDESGLVYMQQRYYDPTVGRFLSIDPVSVQLDDPRSLNRYAYAFNNPYAYTDPTGEYSWSEFKEDVSGFFSSMFTSPASGYGGNLDRLYRSAASGGQFSTSSFLRAYARDMVGASNDEHAVQIIKTTPVVEKCVEYCVDVMISAVGVTGGATAARAAFAATRKTRMEWAFAALAMFGGHNGEEARSLKDLDLKPDDSAVFQRQDANNARKWAERYGRKIPHVGWVLPHALKNIK